MHKDTQAYVKAYDKCQKFSNVIRQLIEELTPIAMEIGYHRPIPNSNETTEVPNSQHRLLHQMGKSWSPGHHHREERAKLCLEERRLQIQDP